MAGGIDGAGGERPDGRAHLSGRTGKRMAGCGAVALVWVLPASASGPARAGSEPPGPEMQSMLPLLGKRPQPGDSA